VLIGFFHAGGLSTSDFQVALLTLIGAEVTIVVLASINMSATAVSREREDGTLDIVLTTPIQPGPYLSGKLRGLVLYLLPMLMVPVLSLIAVGVYCMIRPEATSLPVSVGTMTYSIPLVSVPSGLALLLVFPPFVAFSVMLGLQWSIRSKGTIGSILAAVVIMLVIVAVISAASPFNLVAASLVPGTAIPETVGATGEGFGWSLLLGGGIAGGVYVGIVMGMHASMKKSFMMTVRRLAGTR
jgi:ABC-type transport system involved in multi-copper enzyme maturation permease subunit